MEFSKGLIHEVHVVHTPDGILDFERKIMKKIVSVVLTLAVLFAFVACEATTPTLYGKKVMSVTLASAPAYFEGETIDPSAITLRVVYDNGKEGTLNAADVGMSPDIVATDPEIELGDYEADANSTPFVITYGTDNDGRAQTWKINIPTVELTKLVIDPTNAVKEINVGTTASNLDKTGLAYTAYYKGGSKTVSAEFVTTLVKGLTFDVPSTTEAKTGVEITVPSTLTNVELSSKWIVNAVVDPSTVIDHIELRWDDTQEFFYINGNYIDEDQTTPVAATLANIDYEIVAVMKDGKTEKTINPVSSVSGEGSTVGLADVDFTEYAATQPLNDKSINTFKANVTVKGATTAEDQVFKGVELKISYTEDYVTEFSVEYAGKGYAPGKDVKEADFKFTATEWASGKEDYTEKENEISTSYFDIKPDQIKKGETSNVPVTAVEVTTDNVKYASAIWDEGTCNITVVTE